jgi:FixJ family two-component response regulator
VSFSRSGIGPAKVKDKTLLIVDDEKRMTDSLRDLFTSQGYGVDTANSGAEAIEAIRAKAYPVVVTDLRMQGIDGLNVIRFVHEHRPRTMVIVITGYASTESAIEALHYQAFDYLRKPFEFDQLKSVVDRAFHRIEVNQLREDTAAMITHDIKVPLTSILGFASMIYNKRKEEFHPRAIEFAETIRSNAQKILALVDNYLASCKIETDNLVMNPGKVSIPNMVQDLMEAISNEAARQGFEIKVELEAGLEEAWFDEPYVFRSVGNLLQNAVKYGDPSGPIVLSIGRISSGESPIEKPSLRLEVINRAPGMEQENLD